MDQILLIYQGHYPWDVRIEKFIETISKEHIVHLLSRNLNNSKSIEKVNDNFYIHRLQVSSTLLSTPFHYNFLWGKFIDKKIYEIEPSLLIVRDLPLAKLAINKGGKYSIPVIFDNAENYPEFIRTFSKYQNVVYKFLNKIGYFVKLEEFCILNSFKTINVIEENSSRLSEKIPKERMVEIYNVPKLRTEMLQEKKKLNDEINICYVGAVSDDNLRGVRDLILADKFIKIRHKIHIFGDGNEKERLMELSKSEFVDENIIFHGQVKYSDLEEHLIKMDIGVVTHRKNAMTDTTMANKIYEYLSYGMCVVSSDAIPLKRFTLDNKIGLVYESGNFEELGSRINECVKLKLLTLKERKYREQLFLNSYNWDIEQEKLIGLINKARINRDNHRGVRQ